MNKNFRLIIFIFFFLVSINFVFGAECKNVITTFNFNSGAEIREFVNTIPNIIHIPDDYGVCPLKDRSYSPCSGSARFDDITALKVCQFKNYPKVVSKFSSFYSSPADNTLWYWDNTKNDGVVVWADIGGNSILDRLTCEKTEIQCTYECNDGKDNDNDGKIDLNDKGCVDANDDNEVGEPIGYLDAVQNCQKVIGWTCDSDNFNTILDVKIYKDGPIGTGTLLSTVRADVAREPGVGAACGGNPNHGYSFDLPASLKDGQSHNLYAYAVNIGTPAKDVELTNTPLTFTCSAKCDATQTIFKTLTEKSSNAALYNDASFFNQICYDKIFGKKYPVPSGTDPHTCIADNKNVVLWLKSNTNSKVSTIKTNDFQIPVCYGDLKCKVIDTAKNEVCNPEEKLVASLASLTNSSLSEGNDPNFPIKICCKTGIALNSVYWANNREIAIKETSINSLVKLIVLGTNIKDEQLQFTIYRKETFLGFDFLAKDSIIAKESSKGFDSWRAGLIPDGRLIEGEYYFEVVINQNLNSKKSTKDNSNLDLRYLKVTAPKVNEPPVADILSPEDGDIFFHSEKIAFVQGSYDIDDNFEYTWDFNDGTTLSGNSKTLENFNPVHAYIGITGQKTIKLVVKDDRGKTSTDTVSILILKGSTAGENGLGNITVRAWNDTDGDGVVDSGEILNTFATSNGTVKRNTKISDGLAGFNPSGLITNDFFGSSVTSIGDLDGDGIVDLAVGAYFDENLENSEGAVYILFMNDTNGTVKRNTKISDGLAGFNPSELDIDDRFGFSVTSIGDLDGNGIVDLAVGAYTDENLEVSEGAIYILFLNDTNGTVKRNTKISDGLAGFNPSGLDDNDFFGSSVISIGDLDGNGIIDLAVGAYQDENLASNASEGAIYILFLNDTNGTVKRNTKISDGLAGFNPSGLDAFDNFGYSVTSIGDLDGNGIIDLAVGARLDENLESAEGAIYILFLNDTNGTVKRNTKISDGLARFNPSGLDSFDIFGNSVTSIGDLDGDGIIDLAVGSYQDENLETDEGAIYILFLNDTNGTVKRNTKISDGLAGFNPSGLITNDFFGSSVTSIGDLDGDGIVDLAVGARLDENLESDEGAIYILNLNNNVNRSSISFTILSSLYNISGILFNDTNNNGILNAGEIEKQVFSFIALPKSGKIYERLVSYDASKTYAVESITGANGCTKTINCLGGLCPKTTKGTPVCYASIGLTGPVPISSSPSSASDANYNAINFCWKYDAENEICTTGRAGALFEKLYRRTGIHNSKLNASVTSIISSLYETIFFVSFDNDECRIISDENEADLLNVDFGSYWISSSSPPANSMNDCFNEGGVDSSGNSRTTCCPQGYSCTNDKCEYELKNSCSDFKNAEECALDDGHKNIAENQLDSCKSSTNNYYGNNNICPIFNSCKCEWDSIDNICDTSTKNIIRHELGNSNYELWDINNLPSSAQSICYSTANDIIYKCNLRITSNGDCNSGEDFYTESWTVEYLQVKNGIQNLITTPITDPNILDDLPPECREPTGSRVVNCEKVIKLPFFDSRNFIITILTIIIICYFMIKKRK